MRTKLLRTFALGLVGSIAACSSSSSDDSAAGSGATGAGGSAAGAQNTAPSGSPGAAGTGLTAGGTLGSSSGGNAPLGGGGAGVAGTGFTGTGGTGFGTGGNAASAGTAGTSMGAGGFGFPMGGRSGSAGSSAGTAGNTAHGGAGTGGSLGTGGASHSGGAGGTGQAGAGGSGGATVACNGPALSGGTQHCSSNGSGTANGFTWTIWSSGSGGCMTTYNTGSAFKATWNNSGDFLAREGFQWDETKTYDQLGTISADYSYAKTGSGGGYSYIGIYGWSNNPLVEYYIVDDWFGNGPPTGGGTKKGSFTIDGAEYDVYQHTQTNQPSIHGTATFPQFFSVRKTARQCGHISISEHFKEWSSLGMSLGKMYEAKLLLEVGGGQGSIDYSAATMTAK